MSRPRIRPPGTRRERCARWLGLDHNPLRRPTDRVEGWLRLLMLALILTAVPVTAIGWGLVANQVLAHRTQVAQRSDHLVSAVLTEQASTSAIDPYMPDPDSLVQARWTAPDGAARTGQILAPAGTPAGRTIPIKVNAEGATVDPPPAHNDVATGTALVGVTSGLMLVLLLMGLQAAARRTLDRQRLEAWDLEWQATGPLWSDHRS
jgi:hypothetical protein